MNSPYYGEYNPAESQIARSEKNPLQLTEEEIRVLKECNSEGIKKRALPFGVTLGFITYVAAKNSPILNHSKFGAIPAVLSSSVAGFFLGKLSYFPVCYERLMSIPDGTVRQRTREMTRTEPFPRDQFPIHENEKLFTQSKPTDIEIPNVSSFDTVSNHLDNENLQIPIESSPSEIPKRHTTYDELREKNRREYLEKMQRTEYQKPLVYNHNQSAHPSAYPGYSTSQQQLKYPPAQSEFQGKSNVYPEQPAMPPGQSTYQRRAQVHVRPSDSEVSSSQDSGYKPRPVKNKYGDEWE